MKYKLPLYEEIPDVGLYLEQVVKYVNGYVEPITHQKVTNSMVSNYVKMGLIDNPVKKVYGRDQIAYLIYVSIAKIVISLEHIQLLFNIIHKYYVNKNAYTYFLIEFNNAIDYVFKEKEELDPLDKNASDGRILLRNTVIVMAHKLYLEYCLDAIEHHKQIKKSA